MEELTKMIKNIRRKWSIYWEILESLEEVKEAKIMRIQRQLTELWMPTNIMI